MLTTSDTNGSRIKSAEQTVSHLINLAAVKKEGSDDEYARARSRIMGEYKICSFMAV